MATEERADLDRGFKLYVRHKEFGYWRCFVEYEKRDDQFAWFLEEDTTSMKLLMTSVQFSAHS